MTITHIREQRRTRGSAGRRTAVVAGIVAVLAGLCSPFAPTASAAPGDGTVTVHVVQEVNANGLVDSTMMEPPLIGVDVTLTDVNGASITVQTDANGNAVFTPAASALVGGQYRVDVANPHPGTFFPSFAANGTGASAAVTTADLANAANKKLSSSTEFVDVRNGAAAYVNAAFWYPPYYCQQNATIVGACLPNSTPGFTSNPTDHSLFSTNYNLTTAPAKVAEQGATGALYGIAYNGTTKRVFSSAVARRSSNYGPGGPGAIYVTDPATGGATLWATVPNVGPDTHDQTTMHDYGFFDQVAKKSLGELEITNDDKYLFVTNLEDQKVYVYDGMAASGANALLGSYQIPNPCAEPADWQPFGEGVGMFTSYVGGVCSAQTSQNRDDMRAVVYAFDPATGSFGNIVLDQSLNYGRGQAFPDGSCSGEPLNTGGIGRWWPWIGSYPNTANQLTNNSNGCWGWTSYPQPILADIIEDTNGDLIIGLRDRFSDQAPHRSQNPTRTGGVSDNVEPTSGADLVRGCKLTDGTFVLDPNYAGEPLAAGSICTNNNVAGTDSHGQPRTFREYYVGDFQNGSHQEGLYSGQALSRVETTIASDIVDPQGLWQVGLGLINRDGTDNSRGLNVPTATNSFRKGGGLADLEVICDQAPIQIGNRVWFDEDRDGIQDPQEVPLPGVTVNLIKDGSVIATVVTNARGEYYFSSLTTAAMTTDTDYVVEFVKPTTGTVNLGATEGTRPWNDLSLTMNEAGSVRDIDSNPDPATGRYNLHVGGPGQNDHTIDAGYIIPIPVTPTFGKTSDPVPGTVVKPGDSVTYTVTAVNPSDTQAITTGTLTDDMAGVLDKAALAPAGATPVLTCEGPAGATCGEIVFNATAKTIVWTASTAHPLSPATTAKIVYTVVINEGATGTLTNVLVEPNITTEHPIITWDKVAVPGNGELVNPGDVVTYTISVKNTGAVASNAFSVTDDLTDVVNNADIDPASITIDPAGLGAASYDAATKLLTWTGVLQPGEEAKVSYSVTVKPDAFGELRNRYFDKTVVNPVSVKLAWHKVDPEGNALKGSEWTLTPVDAAGAATGPAVVVVDCVAAAAADCTGADTDPVAGAFLVGKLKPGTYSLVETKAPVGFVLLTDPIAVTVLSDTAVTTLPDVVNQQQGVPAIPLTGGWGSDYFLAGGGVLMVLAAGVFLFIWRRRASAAAE